MKMTKHGTNTTTQRSALIAWILSFPQLDDLPSPDESESCEEDWLNDEKIVSQILLCAEEIYNKSNSAFFALQSSETNAFRMGPHSSICWQHICKLIKNPRIENDHVSILSNLLLSAVSHQCLMREEYINRIMKLDDTVQFSLQNIIESNMNKENAQELACKEKRIHERNNSFEIEIGSPRKRRSFPRNRLANITPESNYKNYDTETNQSNQYTKKLQNQLDLYRDENSKLRRNLDSMKLRESELIETLSDYKSKHVEFSFNLEMCFLQRENDLKNDHDDEVERLKNQIEVNERAQISLSEAERRIESLEDEVDLLRDAQSRLDVTEEQLRRCKKRLTYASEVNCLLKKEEEAHSNAMRRCAALENEVNLLLPLRRRLDACKKNVTDYKVKLTECEDELRMCVGEKKLLEVVNFDLRNKLEEMGREYQRLNELLTEHGGRYDRDYHSVGGGISELNPKIREEIYHLRNENSQLNAFVSKRSDDYIQRMEDDLDDSKRLAQTFKEKFLATKYELGRVKRELVVECEQEKKSQVFDDFYRSNVPFALVWFFIIRELFANFV